jgi:hypothetical protein
MNMGKDALLDSACFISESQEAPFKLLPHLWRKTAFPAKPLFLR